MKTVVTKTGLFFRLLVSIAALLLAGQAMAVGTDAGTTVSNQATVAYDVGGNPQTPIESDPGGNSTPGSGNPTDFLVDRRVDFTLVASDAIPTQLAPGDLQAIAAFSLTNDSNAIMDWDLSVADLPLGTDVNGFIDTGDVLINYTIRVANGDGAAGVPDFGTDLDFVDELPEDETVVIYVYADAPVTLGNADIDNFTLNATAADDATATATPGVLDPLLTESPGPDDPTVIESVFANLSGADVNGNATENEDDGYEVVSAALVITKSAAVISDPFSSGKALPGAIIEYTITVDNTAGSSDATDVSMSDLIDSDVTFLDEAYGAGRDVNFDSGSSFCNADDADADLDGCSLDASGNLVVGNVNLSITVAAGTSLTIQFQIEIPNL